MKDIDRVREKKNQMTCVWERMHVVHVSEREYSVVVVCVSIVSVRSIKPSCEMTRYSTNKNSFSHQMISLGNSIPPSRPCLTPDIPDLAAAAVSRRGAGPLVASPLTAVESGQA